MKIENQVCTKEQGKTLFNLGVISRPYFYWVNEAELWNKYQVGVTWDVEGLAVPAFTVAELGVMLPEKEIAVKNVPKWFILKWGNTAGDTIRTFFKPEFLCDYLIIHIEIGIISAEQVNQRLQSA